MDRAPSFSIATPTRNALPKLKRCVGSIRGQNRSDVEHLIQDACSSDGSAGWLRSQSSLCAVSEPDTGMYDAINRAWSRSSGRYLSWLNADEQYLPGTLDRVESAFAAHPDVDVVFANYLVVDDEGLAVAVRREIPLRRFLVANTFLNAQSCTLFFRRTLLERGLLLLEPGLRYAADMDMVLRLLQHGVRFQHVDEIWALFGIDGANLSTHAGAIVETELVARTHGALAWKPLRSVAQALRRAERLFRGGYAEHDMTYHYAVNEVPEYQTMSARGLGGRYSLNSPKGTAQRVSAASVAPLDRGVRP